MNRAELAEKLIATASARERSRLIAANRSIADRVLARHIKDLCYAAWTAEPIKAVRAAEALSTLFKFDNVPEVGAFYRWVRGISDITKGRLESATGNLLDASAAFRRIGQLRESAYPIVAMLIPMAMLGRYDEALAAGKRALRIFERYGDELAAGKVEMNLSNIFARRGQHRRSEKLALAALERFERIGEKTWQTMAENDLANTYTDLNDFRNAEKFYARALAGARASSMRVTEAEVEASIGNLALFRGRYAEALSFMELSRAKYDELGMPHQSAIADLEIAGIYSELNLLAESLEIYRRVATQLRKLKMRSEEARARAELGRTAMAAGDRLQARRELTTAARLFGQEENRAGAAAVMLRLARLEVSERRFAAARELLDSADRKIKASGDERQKITSRWLRAQLSVAVGKLSTAERLLTNIRSEARRLEQRSIEQAAWNLSGKIALQRGDTASAEKNFRNAIELVEALRSPLPAEEYRIAFFSAQLEPYENLAKLYIEQGRIAEAFECFELARSRALVDSMEQNEPAPGQTGEFGRKIAALREELNWFYSRTARGEGETKHALSEIAKREKALAEMMRRSASIIRVPSAGRRKGSDGRAAGLQALQRELGSESVFLEYVRINGSFSLFVVTAKNIEYFPDVAHASEIEPLLAGLRFQFDSLRYGAETIAAFTSILKAKADKYLDQLFEKLIKPASGIIGDRNLVIAPVSILHYLPFHAFRFDGKYLIEQREVSYTPSAAVWQRLCVPVRPDPPNALLLGFADENNPLVAGEVDELKKLFRKRSVLLNEKATFQAYRRYAPAFDILHFACHGQFRPDNPSFSSLHLADGWVTVNDICAQSLKASLVTLSACETGLNEIADGEEIIGLARGFLSAGASAIILSLWTVNDAATAELMKDLYRTLQRGASVPASLRVAQLKSIAEANHPFFWSPFMVIGK